MLESMSFHHVNLYFPAKNDSCIRKWVGNKWKHVSYITSLIGATKFPKRCVILKKNDFIFLEFEFDAIIS